MPVYTVPYADGDLQFDLPHGADVAAVKLENILSAELQVPPLAVGDAVRAVIVFTDATRHSPDQWFAEKILAALPLENITFLCAVGMHRPSTHAEKVAKLGAAIVGKYPVVDHDPAQVVTIGEIDGIPVEVNRLLVEPGTLIIATGVVEPHQYAGYSGGAKTAVIGCGGERTISLTHGPAMLDRDGVRLGAIENNPFQQFVRRAGERIGVSQIANAVMPAGNRIAAAAVGDLRVFDELVLQARKLVETPVPNAPYDVVIAGVGAPKDANLYQASRAATYIGLSHTPVVRQGGVIIVPARMPDGAGEGTGERNFFAILRQFGPTTTLIHHLRQHGCQPGEQRAYMIAQLVEKYHCIFVGAKDPSVVTEAGLLHAATPEEAFRMAAERCGTMRPKTLVVPHALNTLPVTSILVQNSRIAE